MNDNHRWQINYNSPPNPLLIVAISEAEAKHFGEHNRGEICNGQRSPTADTTLAGVVYLHNLCGLHYPFFLITDLSANLCRNYCMSE